MQYGSLLLPYQFLPMLKRYLSSKIKFSVVFNKYAELTIFHAGTIQCWSVYVSIMCNVKRLSLTNSIYSQSYNLYKSNKAFVYKLFHKHNFVSLIIPQKTRQRVFNNISNKMLSWKNIVLNKMIIYCCTSAIVFFFWVKLNSSLNGRSERSTHSYIVRNMKITVALKKNR